jgi:DNA-cytosine methyltransferase
MLWLSCESTPGTMSMSVSTSAASLSKVKALPHAKVVLYAPMSNVVPKPVVPKVAPKLMSKPKVVPKPIVPKVVPKLMSKPNVVPKPVVPKVVPKLMSKPNVVPKPVVLKVVPKLMSKLRAVPTPMVPKVVPTLMPKSNAVPKLMSKPKVIGRSDVMSKVMPKFKAKADALSTVMPKFMAKSKSRSTVMPKFQAKTKALSTVMPKLMTNAAAACHKRKLVESSVGAAPSKKANNRQSTQDTPSPTVFSNIMRPIATCRPILVGSDCSGWCSEHFALDKLGVYDYVHTFACDINKWSKKFIMQNVGPRLWYDDCLSNEHKKAPYVDLYVAGFPCQPFSKAGKNLGLNDFRGQVVYGVLDYISRRQPAVFILENVKNLLAKTHTDAWHSIIQFLCRIRLSTGQLAYSIDFAVLNSKNYGVPQNRERVYIVGRRHDKITAQPDALQFGLSKCTPPPIRRFLKLEAIGTRGDDIRQSASTSVMKKNLDAAHLALTESGLQPHLTDMVVDIGSGQGLNMMHNMCPTITRTRGQNRSYYLTSIKRRLSAFELCRLQGVEPCACNWHGIPPSAIGSLAGNAMTVPVLAHVIRAALLTTGLAKPRVGGAPIVFP